MRRAARSWLKLQCPRRAAANSATLFQFASLSASAFSPNAASGRQAMGECVRHVSASPIWWRGCNAALPDGRPCAAHPRNSRCRGGLLGRADSRSACLAKSAGLRLAVAVFDALMKRQKALGIQLHAKNAHCRRCDCGGRPFARACCSAAWNSRLQSLPP